MHKFKYTSITVLFVLAAISLAAKTNYSTISTFTPTTIAPKEFSSLSVVITMPIITEVKPTITKISSTSTIISATETNIPSTLTIIPATATEIPATEILVVKLPEPSGMFGAPSLWPKDIDAILKKRGSPAYGNGQVFWDLGVAYKIDPAYFLAFFAKESSMGADPNWQQTNNPGNIICLSECTSRFQYYDSWAEGAEAWYSLISRKYAGQSVHQILSVYAPASDGNNPNAYADTVLQLVQQWRTR